MSSTSSRTAPAPVSKFARAFSAGRRAAVVGGLTLLMGAPAAAEGAKVAAASDLMFALDEIARDFKASSGHALRITYGASGQFVQQLLRGAPFEVFMSADERYVERLFEAGWAADRGQRYASGRLALYAPKGSALKLDASTTPWAQALQAALTQGAITKFAIANPEHAPYGRAAVQAVQRAGLEAALAPRLIYGENASQAAQFVASGSAQAGLVPYSLTLAPSFRAAGQHQLVPVGDHEPIHQRMAVSRQASAAARAFAAHMQTPRARAILLRHGLDAPVAVTSAVVPAASATTSR